MFHQDHALTIGTAAKRASSSFRQFKSRFFILKYDYIPTQCITGDFLSVNLIAPMELTRMLLPDMLERRQGHIINVSSLSGKIGEIYNSLYSTSKGGIELWTDALRQELHETGVRVSAVAPGGVTDSGMIHNIGVPYPAILGSCTAKDVATAVVRCTVKDHARLFVNSLPVRPLLLLGLIAPRFLDALLRWIGLSRRNREKVYRRMRLDQDISGRTPAS